MATRGKIILKINETDKGKKLHFSLDKLPSDCVCANKFIDKVGDVTLNKNYIAIYNHFDSYISEVGKTLLTMFNDYDSILNLLLGGDTSTIADGHIFQYCACYGDDWEDTEPIQEDVLEHIPKEDFNYVFKDNEWYVKEYKGKEWSKLSECI